MQERLKRYIRDIPDFPRPGILFKDITPLVAAPEALGAVIDHLAARYEGMAIDKLVAVESRGFIFGAPLACRLKAGMLLVRKPGKLPARVLRQSYQLEYGTDCVEMHEGMLVPGERVLVVDDLLATGGTANAAGELVRRQGAAIVEYAFVVELSFLKGREHLDGAPIHSILQY